MGDAGVDEDRACVHEFIMFIHSNCQMVIQGIWQLHPVKGNQRNNWFSQGCRGGADGKLMGPSCTRERLAVHVQAAMNAQMLQGEGWSLRIL